jgi:hypothetical protein
MNSVLYLGVPYNAGKLWSVLTIKDLWSSAQLYGVNIDSKADILD